ncbi:unnamed protein product [Didymodactylos carnosus]|uniref:Uncharacterized protein n=1 Tax=Didymodactylos carnosus TaxID=1234261 RepID=A0A814M7G2_9BILA|nr:unnamed protein product [Didymodactylos carnosus]CAF1372687.1 unnamed protein product [Didymodactylos carnosus]CAF3841046.1 unnamed protein product [Didymodactylos carnosus]CAF4181600.1 unnamed protein product [Didymodactylos carnosus]
MELASQGQYSFEKLKLICSQYEDANGVMQHETKSAQSYKHFIDKDLPTNEAHACAFAISFYTGSKSETINAGAAILARKRNGEKAVNTIASESVETKAIIMYYLIKGLSYIPFYWGIISRAAKLTEEELKDYIPGAVITWIQFSSSMKGSFAP